MSLNVFCTLGAAGSALHSTQAQIPETVGAMALTKIERFANAQSETNPAFGSGRKKSARVVPLANVQA